MTTTYRPFAFLTDESLQDCCAEALRVVLELQDAGVPSMDGEYRRMYERLGLFAHEKFIRSLGG